MSVETSIEFWERAFPIHLAKAASLGAPRTCRGEGCYACCKEPVSCFRPQVVYLLEMLDEAQKGRVAARLRTWLTQVQGAGLLTQKGVHIWHWRQLNVYCPFLENGKCMVYARRPLACRAFNVSGNPDDCFDDEKRLHQVFMVTPELNASALAEMLEHDFLEERNLGVWLAELLLDKHVPHAPGPRARVVGDQIHIYED